MLGGLYGLVIAGVVECVVPRGKPAPSNDELETAESHRVKIR
jgi:hypothetical protein